MSELINTEGAIVVGLTGQSGAGKTTLTDTFTANDFYSINADKIAKVIMYNNTPCFYDIVGEFGGTVIAKDGTLNRTRLAEIVFTNKDKLRKLNAITHPYIVSKIHDMVVGAINMSIDRILIDAPTLFESGCDKMCDIIVSVIANRDLRVKRVIARDNITRVQAENRINSQLSEDFFRMNSDYVIENNSSLEDLKVKATALVSEIIKKG